jgi:hypothetical protein
MLELILGFMVYDTVKTINKNRKQKEKKQRLEQLRFRLNRPMTRGHSKQCVCRLCVNRRTRATEEFNQLLGGV